MAKQTGVQRLGGSLKRLGMDLVELPKNFWNSLSGHGAGSTSKVANGLAGGASRVMDIPASMIERRPFVAGLLGILGLGALAHHFLSSSTPASTADGLSPEETGRALAQDQIMRADAAATRDVNMAMASMQQGPMMGALPANAPESAPNLLLAGSGNQVGGGSYQGRMQAPIEQNLSH